MSQILFKRGMQATLDDLNSSKKIQDGTFYVTEDSHRLYLGVNKGSYAEAVPLGSVMNIVSTTADLPTPTAENFNSLFGELYLVSTTGQLLTINEDGWWLVLNQDLNYYTDDHYAQLQSSADGSSVTFKDVIQDNRTTQYISQWHLSNDDKTLSFTVQGETQGTDTVYTVTVANKLTLLTADNNVKGVLQFGVKDETPINEVDILGLNGIAVSSGYNDETERNEIKIDAVALNNQIIATVANSFDAEGKFTTTLTNNNKDQITSEAITPTIYYGDAIDKKTLKPVNSAVYANGEAILSVYTKAEIDNKIANQFTNMDAVRYMGTIGAVENLDYVEIWENVTPKKIIKPKLPNIGDAYKITVDRTYTNYGRYMPVGSKLDELVDRQEGEEWAYKGDLLIANGTEAIKNNSDLGEVIGVITPTSFKWDYVPSGDDFDTTYIGNAITNGIALKENQYGGNQDVVLSFKVEEGYSEGETPVHEKIVIREKEKNAEDPAYANAITISHSKITTTFENPTEADQDEAIYDSSAARYYKTTTFNALTGCEVDGYGHITKVSNENIDLIDTNASMRSVEYAISTPKEDEDNYQKQATITNTVTLQHYNDNNSTSDNKSDNFTLTSGNENLFIHVDQKNIALQLEWGTF